MTDTSLAGTRNHHRRPILRLFEGAWFVFPLLLLAATFFVPALQSPVWIWPVPAEHSAQLPWGLLAMTLAAVVWLIIDFFVISNLGTPVGSLRLNTVASVALALALTFYAGWSWSTLSWGYLVPWVASILDAIITGDRAINNAAQKPLITTGKG
jgi:hypothetical protein